ncbi:MAG TPA: Loki-CTERM sorting domain-containing protein [Methylomirabilota bacterium]|nr:Loki-CTERM sorting domain-containing protein [Methylomirabilota bacterium]
MYLRSLAKIGLWALLCIIVTLPGFSMVNVNGVHSTTYFAPATFSSDNVSMPLPAIGYSSQLAPVSGVVRVLVIAAAFSDINYTLSIEQVKQNWFGSVAAYYHEISYGKLTIEGDIYGWYKLPYPESHYGRDCLSTDDADCSGSDASWQIAQDAVHLAQKDVDFKNYDYFIFIHSGNGQESTGVKNDVWSVTYMWGVNVQAPSRSISLFSVVPELEAVGVPNGVYCLEFGHDLGLPDLYNTNNGQPILGPWELMDEGSWNGDPRGSSPAHMTAWGKIQLGFISGAQLATANPGVTSTFIVDPTEIGSSDVHAVEIPLGSNSIAISNPSQYYLVEVRSLTGFDSALPAAGALITYVDNTLVVGKVHVIDGHPSTPKLRDAVWNVGQTFTDSKNGLSVTVTGKVGDSYQITVNRGGAQPPPQIQNQTSYVDLAVTTINSHPAVITTPNTTVTITVDITNLGTKDATNTQIQVNLDGAAYWNTQVNVGAGSSTEANFTWISVIGNHIFQVKIDPNNLLNDTDRSNNVATFDVSVGPTLTINMPLNISSNENAWAIVNGVKYNVTSGQLQTSVSAGNITVQVQPVVDTAQGVREEFSKWSDGATANPRTITVSSNVVLQVVYSTQYLLSVNQNGGSTSSSGWYNAESIVTVTASDPSNVTADASRLKFTGWSGDMTSNETKLQINMTKPVSLSANWITQYYLTIISATGSPTGNGWYDAGQIATVDVQSTVQFSNATRLAFTGWNSTTISKSPTTQVVVNSPTILLARWQTQYLVNVQSPYGEPSGGGWYNAGSNAAVQIEKEVDYANSTRIIFTSWTGDYAGSSPNATLRVNAPKTLNANWKTEYLITFKVNGIPNSTITRLTLNNSTYDLPANSNYQLWFERGSTITPILNQTIPDGFIIYTFTGWTNSTGQRVEAPLPVNAPVTYIATYTSEMSLPPIPGFPIEALLLGISLGLGTLALTRRKQEKQIN